MNSVAVGRRGETRVSKVLPGAVHINGEKQAMLPYDVLWDGIMIDVKNTEKVIGNSAVFGLRKGSIRHNNIILVFTTQIDGHDLFWVDKYHKETKSRFKLHDAIEAHELAEAILKETRRIVMPIDEDTKPSFVAVSVSAEDYEMYDQLRRDFAKSNGLQNKDVSMAMIIRIGMKFYKDRKGMLYTTPEGAKKR